MLPTPPPTGGPNEGSDDALLTVALAPAQETDEIGRLGDYRILATLGQGGMGIVFHAEDVRLRRPVALKAMLPQLAGNPAARERFFREARAIAALRHDHVVIIHQVGEDRGTPFLAMEFLEGETLDACLHRERRLSCDEVLRIGREAAEGLAHAHERGLIHRDIKPANVWLEGDRGRVKLLDFGLARGPEDVHLTRSGAILGTPAFMSPEQARGGPVDARSDLYSLGVLLYRACTGELPLKARDTLGMLSALALEIPAEPRSHVPTLPAGLNDLIVSLLAKRPEDRPRSAAAVASRLAALQDPSGPRRPAAVGRAASWGVLCGACLAGLAVAGFLASRAGSRPGPTPTGGLPTRLENRVGMEFMLVPKGRLFAGGGGGQVGEREVTVENFYLGKFEVTQGQWQAVTGSNPSYFSRTGGGQAEVADVTDAELGRFPVDSVSWHDCQHFAEALTRAEGASGRSYRLPTADEWEYACRGGPPNTPADHSFDFYPERPANILLPAQANFKDAGRNRPAPVGSYPPNRLGLHDLHGNVWEWCADATADGADRFFRGGGWSYEAGQCRAAVRETNPPTTRIYPIGVRLVLVAAGN